MTPPKRMTWKIGCLSNLVSLRLRDGWLLRRIIGTPKENISTCLFTATIRWEPIFLSCRCLESLVMWSLGKFKDMLGIWQFQLRKSHFSIWMTSFIISLKINYNWLKRGKKTLRMPSRTSLPATLSNWRGLLSRTTSTPSNLTPIWGPLKIIRILRKRLSLISWGSSGFNKINFSFHFWNGNNRFWILPRDR